MRNKNKKAVSLMLSYVILVLIALAIGTGIYVWMSNLPSPEGEACPKGVSLVIREATCDSATDAITLTIANKGRFNIHGLVVRGSDDPAVSPIVNLNENDPKLDGSISGLNRIIDASGADDPLEPDEEDVYVFTYSGVLAADAVSVVVGAMRIQDGESFVCETSFVSSQVSCI